MKYYLEVAEERDILWELVTTKHPTGKFIFRHIDLRIRSMFDDQLTIWDVKTIATVIQKTRD